MSIFLLKVFLCERNCGTKLPTAQSKQNQTKQSQTNALNYSKTYFKTRRTSCLLSLIISENSILPVATWHGRCHRVILVTKDPSANVYIYLTFSSHNNNANYVQRNSIAMC
jgi:hypothetical protein